VKKIHYTLLVMMLVSSYASAQLLLKAHEEPKLIASHDYVNQQVLSQNHWILSPYESLKLSPGRVKDQL